MKTFSAILASGLAFASFGSVAQTSGPTDAQIAAIVVTANQVDIDAGRTLFPIR
jgi:putative membrane protein